MPKVNLHFHSRTLSVMIESDDAASALKAAEDMKPLIEEYSTGGDWDDHDDGEDSGSEPSPKPRKRRTKAQIAADKAKAAEGDAKTEDSPAEEKAPEAPTVTEDEVRAAAQALIALGADGAMWSVKIVEALGAKDDKGNAKLSAMKPESFAEAKRLFEEKLAELKSSAAAGVL